MLSVLGGCAPAPNHSGHVTLDAACGAPGGTDSGTRITVTIRNGTPSHLTIVVGVVLGSGDHLAEALSLRLTRPGGLDVERYGYAHPRYPGVAGRMDPWRLEVAAGRAASLDVDAQTFSVDDVRQAFFRSRRGRTDGPSPWPRFEIMVGQPARSTVDGNR
jgi:hypothetical protein